MIAARQNVRDRQLKPGTTVLVLDPLGKYRVALGQQLVAPAWWPCSVQHTQVLCCFSERGH